MILDLGKAPSNADMVSMIKAGADICHQDKNNALLLRYPVKYAAQTMTAYLSVVRNIEDKVWH